MPIVQYKPTSPGRRFRTGFDFSRDHQGSTPERVAARAAAQVSGGRNNLGRMTTRHRGGGHKRRYRVIDFRRDKDGVPAKVAAIEYDPNRSARIALLHYADGEKRYILAPVGLRRRRSGRWPVRGADIKPGNCLPLSQHPARHHGAQRRAAARHAARQLGRSAGAAIQLMAKEGDYALLKLPSGELRLRAGSPAARRSVRSATSSTRTSRIGKAGRIRWLGRRSQRPRHRDEPGRPSARRRRGTLEGQPSADARGASRPRATRPATTSARTRFIVKRRKSK